MLKVIIGLVIRPLLVRVFDLKTHKVTFEPVDNAKLAEGNYYANALGKQNFQLSETVKYKRRNSNYAQFEFDMLDGEITDLPVYKSDFSIIKNKKLVIVAEVEDKGYLVVDITGKEFAVPYGELDNWVQSYDFYNYNSVAVSQHEFHLYPVIKDPQKYADCQQALQDIVRVCERETATGVQPGACFESLMEFMIQHPEISSNFNIWRDLTNRSLHIQTADDTPNYGQLELYCNDRKYLNLVLPIVNAVSSLIFYAYNMKNCYIKEGVRELDLSAYAEDYASFEDAGSKTVVQIDIPSTIMPFVEKLGATRLPYLSLYGDLIRTNRNQCMLTYFHMFDYLVCTRNPKLQEVSTAVKRERGCSNENS